MWFANNGPECSFCKMSRKDQISGISRPNVGLEIQLNWSFSWQPAPASPAKRSLADHTFIDFDLFYSVFLMPAHLFGPALLSTYLVHL